MFRKRKSRSVVTLPKVNDKTVHDPKKLEKTSFDECLGEDIQDFKTTNSQVTNTDGNFGKRGLNEDSHTLSNWLSASGSEFEDLLDLNTKPSGLSSSSSLSWSEDYEVEVTKKVQVELEKLHKAFQGSGKVPPPQDPEEIEEWKHFFPNLSILGQVTPTNSPDISDASSGSESENNSDSEGEDSTTEMDFKQSAKANNLSIPTKKSPYTSSKKLEKVEAQPKKYHPLMHKPRSLEIEKYLKIFSLKTPDTAKRKEINQQTSKKPYINEDATAQCFSLPYISATSKKTWERRQPDKQLPKFLSLPPIRNDFRSISATPRHASSKSMYDVHFKDSSAQIRLTQDLMKLFDHIPKTNR